MDKKKNLLRVKNYIDKMPALPTTVTKIMEICNSPNTSPADLNTVISLDPVLMGKVMRLINSAYYGLSQEITSLVRAIIMLGINTVKNLALSTAILTTLGHKENFQAINMEGFWRHSLCVGVTAKIIAKRRGIEAKGLEEFFVAGLLHDIGKIPLNNKISEQYLLAMSFSDRDRKSLIHSEKEAMGLNHSEIGTFVAKAWKLGAEVQDPILYHHVPERYEGPKKNIVYTVAVANYFANYFEIGFSGNRYCKRPPAEIFKYLDVTMAYLEEVEDMVNEEIDKASIFLKLDN